MMVQLTEDMIMARTRVSNMAMVKKLNCWGADLTDVSVVRRLQGVEVLSLRSVFCNNLICQKVSVTLVMMCDSV